jgi:hypothetical protein
MEADREANLSKQKKTIATGSKEWKNSLNGWMPPPENFVKDQ